MQDALRVIGANYEAKTHRHVAFYFGGSNVLARQIRAHAPFDVFLSADEAQANAVPALVRRPLVSNFLAVVSNRHLNSLADLRSVQRIAIADPDAGVPAGVYAKLFLQDMHAWKELEPKIIPMENVRAVLAAADRGSVDAGFVYITDVAMAKQAKLSFAIEARHIIFPAVLLTEEGRAFYDYLFTEEATKVFRELGFGKSNGNWGALPKNLRR